MVFMPVGVRVPTPWARRLSSLVNPLNPFDFSSTLGKLAVFEGLASEGVQYGVGDVLEYCGWQRKYGSSDGGNVVDTR
jgi:hypothetical protein